MKISSRLVGTAFAAATLVPLGGAEAAVAVSGLYNTGVNATGGIDNAWTIPVENGTPMGDTRAYVDTNNSAFPIGPWLPSTNVSAWDSPFTPASTSADPVVFGNYTYLTTFTINGSVSAANSLSFRIAVDNRVGSIAINGVTFLPSAPVVGFETFSPVLTATGYLKSGLNTFSIGVINDAQSSGNPTGLNVQFTGISGVPEASTWAMMLLGFAGLGLAGYRSSRRGAVEAI